jgi:anti-anti-sigma regulatory factor
MREPRAQDEKTAHRETLLYVSAFTVGILSLLGALVGGVAWLAGTDGTWLPTITSGATVLLCVLAYWLGRRGRVSLAGTILALTQWAGSTGALALGAWASAAPVGYVAAIVIAVLLTGWLGGLILGVISLGSYGVVGWLFLAGWLPDTVLTPEVMLGIDLLRLGSALATVLILVYLSGRQLWSLAAHETERADRHAHELAEVAQQRQDVQAQLEERAKREQVLLDALHQLSAPVLPLMKGLIVMPVTGHLDLQRADRLLDDLLNGITTHEADHVLLDVTGLVDVDADSVLGLTRAIQGARLLGGECALIGVQPGVAQGLVSLGVDLSEIPTYGTLREGVAAISRIGTTDRQG